MSHNSLPIHPLPRRPARDGHRQILNARRAGFVAIGQAVRQKFLIIALRVIRALSFRRFFNIFE